MPPFSIGKGRADESTERRRRREGRHFLAAVEKIRFSNYVLPFPRILPYPEVRWRDGTFCGRDGERQRGGEKVELATGI